MVGKVFSKFQLFLTFFQTTFFRNLGQLRRLTEIQSTGNFPSSFQMHSPQISQNAQLSVTIPLSNLNWTKK